MYTLIRQLIASFDEAAISFCHWKSNVALEQALRGHDDLDLLINKAQLDLVLRTLGELGFVEGLSKGISYPDVWHFYGFDSESGDLIHVHLYASIITGASWTKEYDFPFAEEILAHCLRHHSGMPIPPKHIEYTLFLIRVYAKLSAPIESLVMRSAAIHAAEELTYLRDGMEAAALAQFLHRYFPHLQPGTLHACADTLTSGNPSAARKSLRQLKTHADPYRRIGIHQANREAIAQFVRRVLRRFRKRRKKVLAAGGRLIAVTGLDATGKTTITDALNTWLSSTFETTRIHVGRPPATLLTWPLNVVLAATKRQMRPRAVTNKNGKAPAPTSLLAAIRYAALAHDRLTLVQSQIWRLRSGEVVIADRYPSQDFGVMDSRRLDPEVTRGFARQIARYENRIYRRMPKPDFILCLQVPMDVAVQRNSARVKSDKETESALRMRHAQNSDLHYEAAAVCQLDTSGDLENTVLQAKHLVWKSICGTPTKPAY